MGLLKFLTDTGRKCLLLNGQAASMARIRRAHHVFGVKHLPKPRDESGVQVKQEITFILHWVSRANLLTDLPYSTFRGSFGCEVDAGGLDMKFGSFHLCLQQCQTATRLLSSKAPYTPHVTVWPRSHMDAYQNQGPFLGQSIATGHFRPQLLRLDSFFNCLEVASIRIVRARAPKAGTSPCLPYRWLVWTKGVQPPCHPYIILM